MIWIVAGCLFVVVGLLLIVNGVLDMRRQINGQTLRSRDAQSLSVGTGSVGMPEYPV